MNNNFKNKFGIIFYLSNIKIPLQFFHTWLCFKTNYSSKSKINILKFKIYLYKLVIFVMGYINFPIFCLCTDISYLRFFFALTFTKKLFLLACFHLQN